MLDSIIPSPTPNLPNTDQVYGHGTFVAGVIAGNGQQSAGKYAGVATGANILGLSAGDANLFFVLSGFDYLLANVVQLQCARRQLQLLSENSVRC